MIELYDAFSGFGGWMPGQRAGVDFGQLIDEMDRLEIGRSLVRTSPQELSVDVEHHNRVVLDACRESPRCTACPIVVPGGAGSGEGQVDALLEAGANAVCIRPALDEWIVADWVCGRLLDALRARRVPVLCSPGHVELREVADLAGGRPEVPFVILDVPFRELRTVIPLLREYPNVYASTGGAFAAHRGIEHLVSTVGPDRVLFGTGYPETEPMAAVTQLMYADITESDRAAIGAGNLHRLLGGVLT